ncbi:Uma2 family endonuclease [Tautonia marina]|uniref:Uma2 family endonuclease n=1 Tax=Tautonia marina TaxID=2653855 RepID=UPI0012605B97|nr:Uma2 family endonuclease [Tautonia marina]
MATETKPSLITAEQFMQMDLGDGLHELVRGEILDVPPAGQRHGRICFKTAMILERFGIETGHGYVATNDVAVQTERSPDSVRGADVCYFTHARLPESKIVEGIPPVVPDLVVEVYSPSDRPGKLGEKISEYLNAGVPMVWVLYPERRTLRIDRAADPVPMVLGPDDTVEKLPELPGFRCDVAEFFV